MNEVDFRLILYSSIYIEILIALGLIYYAKKLNEKIKSNSFEPILK